MKCPICDLPLPVGRPCPNYWCGRPDRGFDLAWSAAALEGGVRRAILALKYRGGQQWVAPLAGLLAGFLVDRAPAFDDVDLIVATPGADRTHVAQVLAQARPVLVRLWEVEDERRPALAKRAATRRLVDAPSVAVRRLRAACEVRTALVVADPGRVDGRRVLVVDDVFTDGSTLREVAGVLRAAGASAVSGVVLARAPFAGAR